MIGPVDIYWFLKNPRLYVILAAAMVFLLAVAWTTGNLLPILASGTAAVVESAGAESPQKVGTVLVAPIVFGFGIVALVVIRLAS